MADRETQSDHVQHAVEGAYITDAEEAKAFLRQYLCPGVHPRLTNEECPAMCMATQAFYEAAERCRENEEKARREGLPTGEIHYVALQPPDEAAFHAMRLPTNDPRNAPTKTTFAKVRDFLDCRQRKRLELLAAHMSMEAIQCHFEYLTHELCADFFPLDFTWAQWIQLLHDFPKEDCRHLCLAERKYWGAMYPGGGGEGVTRRSWM
ncbi:hypothetical protein E4U17_007260 [Claviceps sp. LM77 group G4]|nr:hypothetical protein E4U17_007260 [Claviceps sp. LM77 group G4]KAG6083760.1 hypothetical protein E4U16_003465 [Claviceps sp. LM84 group G4]KAG6084936.1 hypothetical protein E4U33_002621 [Claviceps sp. LM78 group G4]